LLQYKMQRMASSSFAFLRGSAPLFYEILKRVPQLAMGPEGVGWIVGDLHLENFGAFRAEQRGTSSEVVFNLNDFDEALVGPWRLDVLRFMTSVLLGSGGMPNAGPRSLEACQSMLDGYLAAIWGKSSFGKPPPLVQKLLRRVEHRTRRHLLDDRTRLIGRIRRFVRGERYRDLPKTLRAQAREAFSRYAQELPAKWRSDPRAYQVEDAAFRVAGTGSLGNLRVGIVARGKGPPDGEWLFDMKEEGVPSPAFLLGDPGIDGGARVATAFRRCLRHPPRMIGRTRLGKTSLFVRRLAPQEDKLAMANIKPDELSGLARFLGSLVGSAHHRGMTAAPRRWSKQQQRKLIDQAVILAGIHEASYLAFCRLLPGSE
jgi:uncharacterized protein (DUF2252 family)